MSDVPVQSALYYFRYKKKLSKTRMKHNRVAEQLTVPHPDRAIATTTD